MVHPHVPLIARMSRLLDAYDCLASADGRSEEIIFGRKAPGTWLRRVLKPLVFDQKGSTVWWKQLILYPNLWICGLMWLGITFLGF